MEVSSGGIYCNEVSETFKFAITSRQVNWLGAIAAIMALLVAVIANDLINILPLALTVTSFFLFSYYAVGLVATGVALAQVASILEALF